MAWEDLTAAQQKRMTAFAGKVGAPNPATQNMGHFWGVVDALARGGRETTPAIRRQAAALQSSLQTRASQ